MQCSLPVTSHLWKVCVHTGVGQMSAKPGKATAVSCVKVWKTCMHELQQEAVLYLRTVIGHDRIICSQWDFIFVMMCMRLRRAGTFLISYKDCVHLLQTQYLNTFPHFRLACIDAQRRGATILCVIQLCGIFRSQSSNTDSRPTTVQANAPRVLYPQVPRENAVTGR